MITRREALQVAAAAAALGLGNFSRAMAQQRLTQSELLRFDHFGNWHEDVSGLDLSAYLRDRPGAL